MANTTHEVISLLHKALVEYIEAAYHIGNPALIAQRRELLDRVGGIYQEPYIESTPRYRAKDKFCDIDSLSPAALTIFECLAQPDQGGKRIFYDPPYTHQVEAIRNVLVASRNIVIMTGTGSGKTESFLLPVLGKLAHEACNNPNEFQSQEGMRALILYPMNALVNDQLGRLRSVFGDPRLVSQFTKWCGRPPRFARYTSRTPYAGMRTTQKDSAKLRPFRDFYVQLVRQARAGAPDERVNAQRLLDELKARGKWPAKADLERWYGEANTPWQDRNTHEFVRAVLQPGDSELITRHEVQSHVPDLLVTNYSMLEYMLMRPIERTVFDMTRNWLERNPAEKFLIVLDEAHLYRGAAGTEVALLLRRLRDRLGINEDRFQVICATASFNDPVKAPEFGAELSGTPANSFSAITGDLDLRDDAAPGNTLDAAVLSSLDMSLFYAEEPHSRERAIKPLLNHLGKAASGNCEKDLFDALRHFPPLSLFINRSMEGALRISELGNLLFPGNDSHIANTAAGNLAALSSAARRDPNEPSLLPCRIHNFFRGLQGLWVCMDPQCSELDEAANRVCGKMYSQPRETCECGAKVLELYTCRVCGTAYARGYCDDVENPNTVWAEPGARLKLAMEDAIPLSALDILLEEPHQSELAEPADYDLETGRINPMVQGSRMRQVYLRSSRISPAASDDDDDDEVGASRGQSRGIFQPCAVCEKRGQMGRSAVQDHETKGDQPFQVLVTRQLQIQPPGPMPATKFAPLRGRKVLAFSDSRQVAARLAPNLQMYSSRDSLRPLIVRGYRRLASVKGLPPLSLDDLYYAVLLAANELKVRLRPELRGNESFSAFETVADAVSQGAIQSDDMLWRIFLEVSRQQPPDSLLGDIVSALQDRSLGLEALAIASIGERADKTIMLQGLPTIPGVAQTDEEKVALGRAWIRSWHRAGFWLPRMPARWYEGTSEESRRVTTHTGKFKAIKRVLGSAAARRIFEREWLPSLLGNFTERMAPNRHRLKGENLALHLDGLWVRCNDCKSVHRPIPGIHLCLDCGHEAVAPLDPDNDETFIARKGYYRKSVLSALSENPVSPISIIAAEHTAQLNAPQNEDVFSKAEENELLFQDVELTNISGRAAPSAIDVLSSTTTMEVGIDIGQLSGVALRNMPPSRANYQQRAGRAGRRGNSIATVVAYGGADTHDEHYFSMPDAMIRGDVVDPILTLSNVDISKRHIRAFLIQAYHQARIPELTLGQPHDLFSVLGTVADFKSPASLLNRGDLEGWLAQNLKSLKERVGKWIPNQLGALDRSSLLDNMASDCLEAVDSAIRNVPDGAPTSSIESDNDEEVEVAPEVDEEKPVNRPEDDTKLLDWLLYKGVLPRYAFPTDVATFHVFDRERSTNYRPIMRFAPSQGLAIALSQYAPGKQVWISGKCYTSGAIYSPFSSDRYDSWQARRLYLECKECGYAYTARLNQGVNVNDVLDCHACGAVGGVGPARYWLRPPGFAHPVELPEVTSPDDIPETSYATRAKLTMDSPADPTRWTALTSHLRVLTDRKYLLVSNTGPGDEGYSYCTLCGRIEASTTLTSTLSSAHQKPYPDESDQQCPSNGTSRHITLGTDFITDIALFSLKLEGPVRLLPSNSITQVALRTVSEAIARAASDILQIEPGEIMAEYRPALTPAGMRGQEAEIFLYDTLPGGAGFARSAAATGVQLFRRALSLMRDCNEGCDSSCYRCLRNYRNRADHALLDRHIGIALLEYVLEGELFPFDSKRIERSTDLLFSDLLRQDVSTARIERNTEYISPRGTTAHLPISISWEGGRQVAVALTHPLSEGHPADPQLIDVDKNIPELEFIFVNELIVRKNLPGATAMVLSQLG